MRDYEEILNNPKLNIRTKIIEKESEFIVQIRAYYTDPVTRKQYWCKFTSAQGWEHLCVSGYNKKVPSWEVMCAIKDIFWNDEECCIEYHPRKSQYVNNFEYCLHIWRPLFMDLPEPDTLLLGFPDLNSEESSSVIKAFLDSLSPEETQQLAEKMGIRVSRQMRRG